MSRIVKGFHVVEGKAYTEDNILVYNVFVCRLWKITKDEILNYFKKFGEIKEVQLWQSRPDFCFIKFTHPEDALKCLYRNHTIINGKCVNVHACHSWHQPGALKENNAPGDNHTVDRTDNAAILKLNDDCLEIIFKKLSPLDQLNLALTCRRLTDVFVTLSRIEYKTLNSDQIDCRTLWKTRQFLQMIGSQINNVNVNGGKNSGFPKLLGKFCTNLKKLTIKNIDLTTHILTKILSRNMSITQLKLHNTNLSDDCISIISKMSDLKSLSLYEWKNEISGRYIKDLINLESLTLNICESVEPCHFKEICENLKALKILKIRNCSRLLTEITIENIVKHLSELETLHINFCIENVIHRLAELPKLKHLQLHHCFPHSHSCMISELAIHLGNQLETLCLDSRELSLLDFTHIAQLKKLKTLMCPNNTCLNNECLKILAVLQDLEVINLNNCKGFTEEGVLDLIKSCGKLRVIHLLCPIVLEDSFTSEALNLYKKRSTKPLTIWKFKPNERLRIRQPRRKPTMLLFDGNNFSEYPKNFEEYMDMGETGDEDDFRYFFLLCGRFRPSIYFFKRIL